MTSTDGKFGTFGGVFTPSILTIFGLVMFMRAGVVVGSMGIAGALAILMIAESIAITTGLSISAISTNTEVKGGGAYFLISRALGPSFGGSIGLCLYFSQTVAIPFYIIGFSESIIALMPHLKPYLLLLNLGPLVIMFIISMVSTNLAIKTQYLIFAILMLAIASFLTGSSMFIVQNGAYLNQWLPENPSSLLNNAFFYFAIFFPAVTGFLSGVNMSGDLATPNRSIPRGTICAILFGLVIYAIQIVITGLAYPLEALVQRPFNLLVENALFHTGYLVTAGVVAATLSSALGSLLGAPRILQALAADGIFPWLKTFAKGRPKNNEPVIATILTFIIAALVLLWASSTETGGNQDTFNPINIMAETVAMFNLFTYALINLAAYVESVGANPSFRPTFQFFNWRIALFGFAGCLIVALQINQPIAILSMMILGALYAASRHQAAHIFFGDARRGFIFSRIRNYLFMLQKMPEDSKNWRPHFGVLVNHRLHGHMLKFAEMFNNQRGLISAISIVSENEESNTREQTLARMNEFAKSSNLSYFSHVISAKDVDAAIDIYLQSIINTPLMPNTIMCGWPHDTTRLVPFLNHIIKIIDLKLNCIITVNSDCPINDSYIDIWWRGRQNGSLMIILAYLLTQNEQFKNHKIRLLRVASPEHEQLAQHEMEELVSAARVKAEIKILPDSLPFLQVFRNTSYDSAAVFLGFIKPEETDLSQFSSERIELLQSMPVTFLVCSNGTADLTK